MGHFGMDHGFTCMHLKLDTATDPDDAYSIVAYEKGFNFLCYLQELVGGEEVMDEFLKAHVQKYMYKSTDGQEWKAFFLDYFQGKGVSAAALGSIDWESWYHKPGMCPVTVKCDTSLADGSTDLAKRWARTLDGHAAADLAGWKVAQTVVFLDAVEDLQTAQFQAATAAGPEALAAAKAASRSMLEAMDACYSFTGVRNAEIRICWQTLCLRAELERIYPHVLAFASEQGRMKFTRPLYRELAKVPGGKQLAIDNFMKVRASYHSICAKMVARDLGVE